MSRNVTVVIPTRNRAALLTSTIASVLAQVDVNVEVVVVDEGSSDETPSLLARYGDPRIRVVRHEVPQGLPAARNAGIAAVQSPWTAFCDDDDLWAPDKLIAQLDAVANVTGSLWSYVGLVTVSDDLRIIGAMIPDGEPDIFRELLQRLVVPGGGSGVLVQTDLVRQVGGFDTSFEAFEDWDLWVRLAGRARVATVRRPLVAYRRHAGAMCGGADRMNHRTSALARLSEKYVREREAIGVRLEAVDDPELYLAEEALRARRRWGAARLHLKLARRHRSQRFLALAMAGIFRPSIQRGRDYRKGAAVPAWWRSDAERWLAPLRETPNLALESAPHLP